MNLPIIKLTPSRILVLGFATVIFLGAFLLTLPISIKSGHSLSFIDALFTATSVVCITGLMVVDTGTYFSQFGQFVIISLIQIGGLGFMTLSTLVALMIGKRIGLKERILIQESFNQISMAGLVRLIRNVIIVTLSFEFWGGLILSIRFLRDFPVKRAIAYGFFHAISAFCNAGFDLFGQAFGPFSSITHYVSDWTVNLTIGGLLVIGGLGFPVLMEIFRFPKTKKLSLHTKVVLKVSAMLTVVGMFLIFMIELNNVKTLAGLDFSGKILGSLFQSITPRTAGFNTLDTGQLREGTWFLMILLMFIGASPSSTGCGIKTTTFALVIATVVAIVKGKTDVEMFERRLPQELVYRAITIIMIALSWVCTVTLIMSVVEPFDFIRLFFEAMSAFGTVGLSTGITSELSDISRILITITMFIGRVGVLTVALALAQFSQPSTAKYIEDRIIIG